MSEDRSRDLLCGSAEQLHGKQVCLLQPQQVMLVILTETRADLVFTADAVFARLGSCVDSWRLMSTCVPGA